MGPQDPLSTGSSVPLLTRAGYGTHAALNLDVSATSFPTPANYGATGNIVHGTIMVRRFPSYVVYATMDGGGGSPVTIPHYFADASVRNLLEIGVGQTDPLRQLAF
jgi:hypothetical protein